MPKLLDALFQKEVAGIYLDHQATDRPRPEAIDAVRQCMERHYGNASALAHARGQQSREPRATRVHVGVPAAPLAAAPPRQRRT